MSDSPIYLHPDALESAECAEIARLTETRLGDLAGRGNRMEFPFALQDGPRRYQDHSALISSM
jgi:hypothetical protein